MAQAPILVHVTSNDMTAAVYADSTYLGLIHRSPFQIDAATRMIRLSTLRAAAWSIPPVQTPVQAAPGDNIYVTLNFPMYHRIESHPFGAEAWLQQGSDRRFLGLTPTVFTTSDTLRGVFQVELDGYVSQLFEPKQDQWNRYELSLISQTLDGMSAPFPGSSIVSRQSNWIEWSASAIILAAGIAAVHYKFKADRINDDYLKTGDASLRPRVARLDDYSGIALGVMQGALVTLAVRFALK